MSRGNKKIQRREILVRLRHFLKENDIVVAALAGTTDDCYETMHRPGNLYSVGMGMVTQVGFGLALALPKWRIIVLDTDGGLLLAPSILPVVGVYKPQNLRILVFDNERLYGSRGGPPSQTAYGVDLAGMGRAAGVENTDTVKDLGTLDAKLSWFLSDNGPVMLIAKVEPDFTRSAGLKMSGQENKFQLIRLIEETEKIEILGAAK